KANFLIFVIVDYLFPILIYGNTAIFVLASMIANLMQHFNKLAQTSIFWQKHMTIGYNIFQIYGII
ncbi:MAG: hypothetical protein KC459_03280, partial [Ruminococcus sp.]|nr:hypothetical protein [Ruminococcus sp.]